MQRVHWRLGSMGIIISWALSNSKWVRGKKLEFGGKITKLPRWIGLSKNVNKLIMI